MSLVHFAPYVESPPRWMNGSSLQKSDGSQGVPRFPAKWYGEQGHWPASWHSTCSERALLWSDFRGSKSQPISNWGSLTTWAAVEVPWLLWSLLEAMPPPMSSWDSWLKCLLAKMPGNSLETDVFFFGGCQGVFFLSCEICSTEKFFKINLIKKNDSCSTWALCPASKNFFKWVRVGLPTDIAPSVRTCFQSGEHQAGATTLWPWRPCASWGAGLGGPRGLLKFWTSSDANVKSRRTREKFTWQLGWSWSASHQCVMSCEVWAGHLG